MYAFQWYDKGERIKSEVKVIHLTENLRNELLKEEGIKKIYVEILEFINACAGYLTNVKPEDNSELEMLKEFSIWFIEPIEEYGLITVYTVTDTDHPIQFMKQIKGYVPKNKLYLANNGEKGYTLMLPDDY